MGVESKVKRMYGEGSQSSLGIPEPINKSGGEEVNRRVTSEAVAFALLPSGHHL